MQWTTRDLLWATALFALACGNLATMHRLHVQQRSLDGIDQWFAETVDSNFHRVETRLRKLERVGVPPPASPNTDPWSGPLWPVLQPKEPPRWNWRSHLPPLLPQWRDPSDWDQIRGPIGG